MNNGIPKSILNSKLITNEQWDEYIKLKDRVERSLSLIDRPYSCTGQLVIRIELIKKILKGDSNE